MSDLKEQWITGPQYQFLMCNTINLGVIYLLNETTGWSVISCENPKQIKYVSLNITTNYTSPSSFIQQVYDP